jgi:hypothetical protein
MQGGREGVSKRTKGRSGGREEEVEVDRKSDGTK